MANTRNRYISLPLAFITVVLMATFPGWHKEEDPEGSTRDVKPFPSRVVSRVCLALVFVASILTFASIFWQHIAAASTANLAHDLGYGSIDSHVGTVSMVLGWASVLLFSLATFGLLVMILSVKVLEETFG